MKKNLPEYLRLRANAAPNAQNVFTCGDVRITVITPQLIRIEQGATTDDATLTVLRRDLGPCAVEVTDEGGVLTLETGLLTVRYDSAKPLEQGLSIAREAAPAFVWRVGMQPLHNLGGTATTLDEADGAAPLQDGVCALDGFAVIDDSDAPLLRADGWFAARKPCLDQYLFGYGHDYTACVRDYMKLTGEAPMLPAWALGNWWSRYHKYTEESYLALMDDFRQKDVPLSVGIVDMDWHLTDGDGRGYHDGWTGYTWNPKFFPDPQRFLDALHARGLRTALNLHPAQGVRSYEAPYAAMCRAMGRDPAAGETIPFNCLDPDFLKAYFETLHFPQEEMGVDFWWLDWQQGTDYDRIAGADRVGAGEGLDGITPLWMLNHMHMLAAGRHGGRGMIFSRFAGYGSQRYPIGFSGDTYITWASLAFQPRFTATAANIGYGWWSHDIGGHMGGIRDDELTARWVQLGVFSPIMRLHSTDSLFAGREPWHHNPRAEQVMEAFMRLRHRLFPYLYTMMAEGCRAQRMLVRPMYHLYPEEAQAYRVPNQYAFGTQMLVAPITEPADDSDLAGTDVWLPAGTWVDAFTGYVYRGGQQLRAYRPMETMPVFLRAGAIVPMQAHVPGENRLGGAAQMEVYVAAGGPGRFALYEDDGAHPAYHAYCETAIAMDWQEAQARITLGSAVGHAGLVPEGRTYTLRLLGFAPGCTITLNGQAAPAAYDAQRAMYTVCGVQAPGEVCIAHPDALLSGNETCRARAIDLLIRAQTTTQAKNAMLERVDAALDQIARGQTIRRNRLGTDGAPNLGGAMFELLAQLTQTTSGTPVY